MNWSTFESDPVSYIDQDRFSACFGGAIGKKGCKRMISTPRLSQKLSEIISSAYNLGPCQEPSNTEDRTIALMSSDKLTTLAQRAGIIYWGNTLASIVLSRDVNAFSSRLGNDLWMLALQNRSIAGPVLSFNSVDAACDAMRDDGWTCLSAWCNSQDEGTGRRVRLKLAPNDHLDATSESPIADLGPAIVRRAAA